MLKPSQCRLISCKMRSESAKIFDKRVFLLCNTAMVHSVKVSLFAKLVPCGPRFVCNFLRLIQFGSQSFDGVVQFLVANVNIWDNTNVFIAQFSPLNLLVPLGLEGFKGFGESHLEEKISDEVINNLVTLLHCRLDSSGSRLRILCRLLTYKAEGGLKIFLLLIRAINLILALHLNRLVLHIVIAVLLQLHLLDNGILQIFCHDSNPRRRR
mmetsp:Transcript_30496/g.70327  ORF Transcript_30496/g.70327 Transcript_30496/m.70327 type:complete len:211 (-) Transcript_30496:91-723(-)